MNHSGSPLPLLALLEPGVVIRRHMARNGYFTWLLYMQKRGASVIILWNGNKFISNGTVVSKIQLR